MKKLDRKLPHVFHVKYLMVVVCDLHLTARDKSTPDTERNDKSLKDMKEQSMREQSMRDANERARQNARRQAALFMAAGDPNLQKRLDKDGMDKFMDDLDKKGQIQAERDTKVREAEKKISPKDKSEYDALGDDEGFVLPHQKEYFLRSKGLL